jgi:hypothetical protein
MAKKRKLSVAELEQIARADALICLISTLKDENETTRQKVTAAKVILENTETIIEVQNPLLNMLK